MPLVESGLLDINATFFIEFVAFVLMLAVLGRYVYPRIIAAAEERQNAIASELEAAEKSNREAEARLAEAKKQLDDARAQAQEVVEGAGRSAEALRSELRQKAEEDARRITEKSRSDIEAERKKAIDSVRGEVADLVVAATEKMVGETLDDARHRRLIDEAIKEVAAGGDSRR